MATQQQHSGLILIHKPAGVTSFDCIRSLKRQWKRTDLGHGGTLDRFATGLLPVLAGEGLKLARFFLESYPTLSTYWKSYRGVLTLGHETDTGDPTGEKTEEASIPQNLSKDSVQLAMNHFVGRPYLQMPPVYSAKKVQGQRSSDLARSGTPPVLQAASVDIRRFSLVALTATTIEFDVECSKGTYIRVLAQDLARELGTRGHLASLQRTAVGGFLLSQAVPLDEALAGCNHGLATMAEATGFLPSVIITEPEIQDLFHGRLAGLLHRIEGLPEGVYCLRNVVNTPLAIMQCHEDGDGTRRGEFLRAFVQSN